MGFDADEDEEVTAKARATLYLALAFKSELLKANGVVFVSA